MADAVRRIGVKAAWLGAAVEAEIKDIGDKLARLHRAIEEGIVELDAQLCGITAEAQGRVDVTALTPTWERIKQLTMYY